MDRNQHTKAGGEMSRKILSDAKISECKYRSKAGAVYIGKKIIDQLDSNEIVFDRENLSFRCACIDDNNVLKISENGQVFVTFTENIIDLIGDYKIEQEGDIFTLIKVVSRNTK